MENIENLSYSTQLGQRIFNIEVFDDSTNTSTIIDLPAGRWDKATIVNLLIREKYSQDRVEAIINNHFINISEWMDKVVAGEAIRFFDEEYEEFQKWRNTCKRLADEIINRIETME
jgi:hypothetical protein